MMAVDLGLLLQNAQTAFANGQQDHGLFLLNYAASFAGDALASSHLPLDVAIGLDAGFVRKANEDCVFTLQGMRPETREGFGLFLICDGMGGHTHGLYAAHLAVASIVETVLPHLMDGKAPHDDWMHVLSTGVQSANRAIYLRNQSMQATTLRRNETRQDKRETEGRLTSLMGTTVTAALVLHNMPRRAVRSRRSRPASQARSDRRNRPPPCRDRCRHMSHCCRWSRQTGCPCGCRDTSHR